MKRLAFAAALLCGCSRGNGGAARQGLTGTALDEGSTFPARFTCADVTQPFHLRRAKRHSDARDPSWGLARVLREYVSWTKTLLLWR